MLLRAHGYNPAYLGLGGWDEHAPDHLVSLQHNEQHVGLQDETCGRALGYIIH